MKRLLALAAVGLLLGGCGNNQPVLDISGGSWPEGTSVAILRGGTPVTTSSLFGGRLTMTLPGPGSYVVRAAHPEFLTALSPVIHVVPGATGHRLSTPVIRRRIGTTRLGIAFISADDDSGCAALLDCAAGSFTSVSFTGHSAGALAAMTARAHSRAVEVILRNDPGTAGTVRDLRKTVRRVTRAAVRCGADGVMFSPDTGFRFDRRAVDVVRELSTEIHGLGMTFALGMYPDAPDGFDPVVFFKGIPAPSCPDEIVIVCRDDGAAVAEGCVVSIERIENALVAMRKTTIPLSRVSIELPLGAVAWEQKGRERRPVELERGMLARVCGEAGTGSTIRLGDGTLSLAYRGVAYAWEDLAGIAGKTAFLRTGEFARVRGVRVVYDGTAPAPDEAGLRALAGVFGR